MFSLKQRGLVLKHFHGIVLNEFELHVLKLKGISGYNSCSENNPVCCPAMKLVFQNHVSFYFLFSLRTQVLNAGQ